MSGGVTPGYDNENRYVDCGNGTVTDTVTNLIWLKNASCWGMNNTWSLAMARAIGLEHGECGLTDHSSPGDWRLPTKEEWQTTVLQAYLLECRMPCLTNTPGTGCYIAGPVSFTGVHAAVDSDRYWSRTVYAGQPAWAWYMQLINGNMGFLTKQALYGVWPVRGGQ